MKLLLLSDLHDDRKAWQWIISVCHRYQAVLYAGDWLGKIKKGSSAEQQIRASQKFLEFFPGTIFSCSGNHDWAEGVSAEGQSLWLSRMGCFPHIKTHGVHHLGQWTIDVVDYMEEPTGGECDGPGTILLYHCPPSSDCSKTVHGIDFGDPLAAERLRRNGPELLCCGHVHLPRSWHARIGRTLILNPGYLDHAGEPNHIEIDTEKRTATWLSGQRREEISLDRQ